MRQELITILISGSISIVGMLVTFIISQRQFRLREKEISQNYKIKLSELQNKLTGTLQDQYKLIIDKRINAYQNLWQILLKYGYHWIIENQKRDINWIEEYLDQINRCNEEHGVFFSQPVYHRFFELRTLLLRIRTRLSGGIEITDELLQNMTDIVVGTSHENGLGTLLKDGLGSYKSSILEHEKTVPNKGCKI